MDPNIQFPRYWLRPFGTDRCYRQRYANSPVECWSPTEEKWISRRELIHVLESPGGVLLFEASTADVIGKEMIRQNREARGGQ
jgi:hypothetical protein